MLGGAVDLLQVRDRLLATFNALLSIAELESGARRDQTEPLDLSELAQAAAELYDPVAEERAAEMLTGVEMCASAMEAIDGANAAVIVTEWPEFGELDLVEVGNRMANPVIVDGRNALNVDAVRAAGLVYEGIGRT